MNPFRDNPEYQWLFDKWGQPNNLGRDRSGGFRYACERCAASWVGPNGDICEWCHQRWEANEATRKRELLLPEFMTWGERFRQLSPIDREVWVTTRGLSTRYEESWLDKLERAADDGTITANEYKQAYARWDRWITTNESES